MLAGRPAHPRWPPREVAETADRGISKRKIGPQGKEIMPTSERRGSDDEMDRMLLMQLLIILLDWVLNRSGLS